MSVENTAPACGTVIGTGGARVITDGVATSATVYIPGTTSKNQYSPAALVVVDRTTVPVISIKLIGMFGAGRFVPCWTFKPCTAPA